MHDDAYNVCLSLFHVYFVFLFTGSKDATRGSWHRY